MRCSATVLIGSCLMLPPVPSAAAAQHVDTVRVGNEALAGAALTPGTYVIEHSMRENGVETPTSTTRQSVRRAELSGIPVWVIETKHVSDDTTRSSIVVRADDLSLVHHRVKATGDSAAVTAGRDFLTGWVVLPDEPIRLLDRALEHPVFPIEGQIPWLFPLLPLEEGYAATIAHFNEWRGEETWQTIRVLGTESIEVGHDRVDCWKVDGGELFPGHGVTYWVDRRTRRVVQAVARDDADGGPAYWSRLRSD